MRLDHLARHQHRRPLARNQHRTHDHVGISHRALDVALGRQQRDAAGETIPQALQSSHAVIDDGDVRTHAQERLGGIRTDHAGSEHNHLGRRDTGHAADQDALAAPVVLQQARRDLGSHGPADLAERPQNRQRSIRRLDLLVGDGA